MSDLSAFPSAAVIVDVANFVILLGLVVLFAGVVSRYRPFGFWGDLAIAIVFGVISLIVLSVPVETVVMKIWNPPLNSPDWQLLTFRELHNLSVLILPIV